MNHALIPSNALVSVLFFSLGMLLSSPGPSLSAESGVTRTTDPTTGLSFVHPSTFHLTRYQDNALLQPAQRDTLPRVLVLAENAVHSGTAPVAIGSLPVISLDVLTGPRAAFNQVFLKPEFRKTIGSRIVYELPAHQGPLHQQVFYYLVPLSTDRIVEIAGHRFYFTPGQTSGPAKATHYDTVIANLIASLTPGTL